VNNYKLILNLQNVDIYVPNDATVTGNCDNENTVTMSLKWSSFVLSWSFAKVRLLNVFFPKPSTASRDESLDVGQLTEE
jgi:hypothetical protein